ALIRSGVLCADTILLSWGTDNSLRIWDAARSVGQSDWLPMMMPTSGFFDAMKCLPNGKRRSIASHTRQERAKTQGNQPFSFVNELLKGRTLPFQVAKAC